jgi:arabinan endo-1,5-alpha-L-arabinosidase
VRPPAAGSYSVAEGKLSWQTQNADLHPPATPLASVLTEPAPSGDYVVETKISVNVPAEGCCQNYVQGGVVIYNDDANYLKLASVSIWNTRQTEWGKNVSGVPAGYPTYGNGVVGPVGDSVYLRIVRRGERYTAYTSLNGSRWDKGGTWTQSSTSHTKIGLISMGGAGFTSTFDYVRVNAVRTHADRD